MKNWRTLALVILLMFTGTSFAAMKEVDSVAVIVNNDVILKSDINKLLQSVKQNAQRDNHQLPDDKIIQNQVVEKLILDKIQLDTAKKLGITISNDDLDKAVANIAAQNRMSVTELRERLAMQGVDFNSYLAQIHQEMLISEVQHNEIQSRVSILPQEVDSLAKQLASQENIDTDFNLSHILIHLDEDPTPDQVQQAKGKADDIMSQLNSGADFSKLAMTYSADSLALEGGKMGWTKLQQLPDVFAAELLHAKKGSIIGPIRTSIGFHIFKVNEIRSSSQAVSVTEYHARHILIRPSTILTDEQARQKIMQIRQEIESGKNFAQLASKYSEDPGSATKGGDLGWSIPDVYAPKFASTLTKLSIGQVSEPIRTNYGWHIIQLIDKRTVDKTNETLKERAYRMLFNRKFSEELQVWLQEERSSAYIKIIDPDLQ